MLLESILFLGAMLGVHWLIGTLIIRVLGLNEPNWVGIVPLSSPPPPKADRRVIEPFEIMDPESPEAEEIALDFLRNHRVS